MQLKTKRRLAWLAQVPLFIIIAIMLVQTFTDPVRREAAMQALPAIGLVLVVFLGLEGMIFLGTHVDEK